MDDMDFTYEHLQDDVYRKDDNSSTPKPDQPEVSLNSEFQDAYKAFSASPWGAKIGGFLGNVVKQVLCNRHAPTRTVSNENRASLSTPKLQRSLRKSAKMPPRVSQISVNRS